MKITTQETYYPYISSEGEIKALSYHSDSSYAGVCLADKNSPVIVDVTVEFNLPDNPTTAVFEAFERQIEIERANAELKIEALREQQHKFLALELVK